MSHSKTLAQILKQIESPLELIQSVFAESPHGIQIYDARGHSLYVNEAFLSIFGLEPPPEYCVLRDEIAESHGILPLMQRALAGAEIEMSGRETLLLIEDEAALREVTAAVLRKRGYTVHTAGSAVEAEAVLRANLDQFDLIISDVIMPLENGPALLARLAIQIPLKATNIWFVSGHSYNKIETSGLKHETTHFLEKPYGVKDLLKKLRRILDSDSSSH